MSKKTSLIIMFIIIGTLLIFHFLILTQQIPYDKVWAGKINSVEEMKTFETFSIGLNVFMLIILIIKYNLIVNRKRNKLIDIFIWGVSAFFVLNTIGNLFAESILELVLGTTITAVSAILCFNIARKEKEKQFVN
ncbi:hypothetical protein [Chondrinema litorale]|uniref:hypothetical protein n=1 Tax=Chondrinema litorale TaxID=2994555 RepID=UPI0025438B0F|nr:hypothetical protein [Chondrinema litorale]UZR97712.1 hypothetical protein OQ292_28315 [Chondrinema litorale]